MRATSSPYTEGLFDDRMFASIRPGAVFANIGRGSVVDEDALLSAVDAGIVSFACLDVFRTEPLPVNSPLWGHPRILVSPHSAAFSTSENKQIAEQFGEYLGAFRRGDLLPHRVDPVHFY